MNFPVFVTSLRMKRLKLKEPTHASEESSISSVRRALISSHIADHVHREGPQEIARPRQRIT